MALRRGSATDNYDPMLITAEGPGLSSGQTGQKCRFTVKGAPHKYGISMAITGPSKPDPMTDVVEQSKFLNEEGEPIDDNLRMLFVPLVPGQYKVTIRWKGKQINGSPFAVNVTGENVDPQKLVSKIKVIGRIDVGKAYSINKFIIDCSEMTELIGGLKVHMAGPPRSAAHLNIIDNNDGTYKVEYKPTSPGMYKVDIKIADIHVPGSPFQVRITEFLST